MADDPQSQIPEAFNSMLRTDYISLNDTQKLNLLSKYYVDSFGLLPEICSDTDQLIVGRRGTGKTTLLYRTLVGCMESWDKDYSSESLPKRRTLGVYIDLSKIQYIEEVPDSEFSAFEHAFVSEVCDAVSDQLTRFWPALRQKQTWFSKLFKAAENHRLNEVIELLNKISPLIKEGKPREVDYSAPVEEKTVASTSKSRSTDLNATLKSDSAYLNRKEGFQDSHTKERSISTRTTYRLTIADVLNILGDLRERARLSAIYLLIDEFSALSGELQRRFCTLLRKLLGSHHGIFIKLCAI